MGLLRNTAAALKGGGAKIIGKQIASNGTGGFTGLTGTDCLGATAGTWHEFGSIETFDIPRDANGVHTLTPTLVEWDVDRRNLLINAAPYSSTTTSSKEELDLEDGTIIESSSGASFDSTIPVWEIVYRGAPYTDGTECAFFCVAQMSRAGGPSTTKSGSFTKPKISFTTVNANGYVCTKPGASGADSWIDGITAPTLSNGDAMGVWVEGA